MSFPDPHPLFMMQSQHFASDAIGVWPQAPMNNDQFDGHSQPFKRPRNSEDNLSDALPCTPMNSRMNPQILLQSIKEQAIFSTRLRCAQVLLLVCVPKVRIASMLMELKICVNLHRIGKSLPVYVGLKIDHLEIGMMTRC